jgi:hypothetical protein
MGCNRNDLAYGMASLSIHVSVVTDFVIPKDSKLSDLGRNFL